MVSAMFVSPYPPGSGGRADQIISTDIIEFIQALDTREIHGYRPEAGYLVFAQAVLDADETIDTLITAQIGGTAYGYQQSSRR